MPTSTTGKYGEDLAARYLEARGYVILDRNYRFQRQEIDLVAYHPEEETLVFVEVKARHGLHFGHGAEAVTPEKQRRIARVAEVYLHERQFLGARVRFDVVAIDLRPEPPKIEHFRDAFLAP